ncbi:hypothetical protein BUALT_Bualt18G0078200 [Buddleja alternifolia]|uniref:Uncharacterized protein n=1 Tax=Buddleja alternifolia TaxID=168488 RepID=A0AAV6W2B0_9LAMI|nr:hypothetical protein BUALT_Bualt18G0078200 [Buddleja alternifolia]
MCCPGKICCCCICLVAVVIAVGLFFGFGVYKHGFKKIKSAFHESDSTVVYGGAATYTTGRPFLGYTPPPPFWG